MADWDDDDILSRLNRNVFDGPAAVARLTMLGLEPRWLVDAVLASEIERRSTSPLEPASAAGSKAWFTGFRVVAEKLIVQEDWVREEIQNLPRMVNTATRTAIAVCGGDAYVGLRGRSPKSKSEKGPQSISMVRSNERQLVLFDQPRFRPLPPKEEVVTWWLLIYSDELGTLRAELSLPVGLDDADHFSDWRERILLEIPTFDGGLGRDQDEDGDAPLEVNVRPRR